MQSMLCAMLRIISQKTDNLTENEKWAEECLQECLEVATDFVNDTNNKHAEALRSGLKE